MVPANALYQRTDYKASLQVLAADRTPSAEIHCLRGKNLAASVTPDDPPPGGGTTFEAGDGLVSRIAGGAMTFDRE